MSHGCFQILGWVKRSPSHVSTLQSRMTGTFAIWSGSGIDGSEYSLHGIRTGATSEAVNSPKKVERTDLKRHGRWKTDSMVDYYH